MDEKLRSRLFFVDGLNEREANGLHLSVLLLLLHAVEDEVGAVDVGCLLDAQPASLAFKEAFESEMTHEFLQHRITIINPNEELLLIPLAEIEFKCGQVPVELLSVAQGRLRLRVGFFNLLLRLQQEFVCSDYLGGQLFVLLVLVPDVVFECIDSHAWFRTRKSGQVGVSLVHIPMLLLRKRAATGLLLHQEFRLCRCFAQFRAR